MRLIEQHKTTLVFSNTRGLAELIFQKLWDENDQGLPIGIHHGSLSVEARRKVEAAMAAGKLGGLVATAELDPEIFRPGALDVLAQHILAVACAGLFQQAELLAEIRSAAPYAGLKDET